jgi:hypothetical protein
MSRTPNSNTQEGERFMIINDTAYRVGQGCPRCIQFGFDEGDGAEAAPQHPKQERQRYFDLPQLPMAVFLRRANEDRERT